MFSPPSPASKNATPSISLRALLVGGENTLSSSPGMVGRSQTFDRRTGVDVPVLDTSCAFIIRDRFLGGRWWSVASGVSWTVVGEDFFSRAAPVSTAFNFNPAGVFFFRFPLLRARLSRSVSPPFSLSSDLFVSFVFCVRRLFLSCLRRLPLLLSFGGRRTTCS